MHVSPLLKAALFSMASSCNVNCKAVNLPTALGHEPELNLQLTCVTLSELSNTCRSSNDGKENASDDLQLASEEGSVSSMGGQREAQHSRGNSSPPRELVQELIEENTRLYEENKKLGEK